MTRKDVFSKKKKQPANTDRENLVENNQPFNVYNMFQKKKLCRTGFHRFENDA